MEHAADTAEAAAVDRYFPSPTENVFVPVYLRTPENRRMIVMRPRSSVGGAIRGVVTALKPVRAEQVRRPD